MIPIYLGYDPREEVGTHVFVSSVLQHATSPVSFCPLAQKQYHSFYKGGDRDGTNAFVYTRFLIPFLQDFRGWAIFADGADMVCKADISELWALRDYYKAVMTVQHQYMTRHPRKYVGTAMEAENRDYPRKNWSSLMLINCGHFAWRLMTPEKVEAMSGADLHQLSWIPSSQIGELPSTWNWLADEAGENPDANLLHWTAGIPAFPAYRNTPHAADWFAARETAISATA